MATNNLSNIVNVNKIMDIIQNQLTEIMSDDYEFYQNTSIILSNEQQFIKKKERKPGCIYIVFKISSIEVNYGQIALPITLNVISEQNGIEICQQLLLEFSQRYNLQEPIQDEVDGENYLINQLYNSPTNISNFNEMFTGFRSVFYLTGIFLISKNANTFDLYYHDGAFGSGSIDESKLSKIETVSNYLSFDINPDSQPFFNTGNRTKTVNRYGTLGIGFTGFLTHGGNNTPNFYDRILKIMTKSQDEPDGVNTTFYFYLVYKNGLDLKLTLKLANYKQESKLGEIPIVTITLIE